MAYRSSTSGQTSAPSRDAISVAQYLDWRPAVVLLPHILDLLHYYNRSSVYSPPKESDVLTIYLQATIFITLVGICWAVAMWVPFTIIMEVRCPSSLGAIPLIVGHRSSKKGPHHNPLLSEDHLTVGFYQLHQFSAARTTSDSL